MMTKRIFAYCVLLPALGALCRAGTPPPLDPAAPQTPATIVVATCDSADHSRNFAALVADCEGDEQEINAAIAALPPAGGVVLLSEGTYDIRRAATGKGGIQIGRSNVTLRGSGLSTKLILADDQNTNVIRVTGDGTHDVTIEELEIDGNRERNFQSASNVFEICGVKASSSGTRPLRNIVVRNTKIYDAYRLNIMLDGIGVKIVDNWLGDAGSDVAEVLTGPGEISRNHVEISGTTGHALGSDAASGVTISDNIVLVLPSGRVTQSVYRTWQGQYHNVFANNQALVYGQAANLLDMRGYFNVVNGNILRALGGRSSVSIQSSAAVTGNIFTNADIEIVDTSGESWPVSFTGNLLFQSELTGATKCVTQSGNSKF